MPIGDPLAKAQAANREVRPRKSDHAPEGNVGDGVHGEQWLEGGVAADHRGREGAAPVTSSGPQEPEELGRLGLR